MCNRSNDDFYTENNLRSFDTCFYDFDFDDSRFDDSHSDNSRFDDSRFNESRSDDFHNDDDFHTENHLHSYDLRFDTRYCALLPMTIPPLAEALK